MISDKHLHILLAIVSICSFSCQFSVNSLSTCPALQKPANGTFSGKCNGTATFLDKCTFTCSSGFLLKGSKEVKCGISSRWESQPPTCVNSCQNVTAPVNGTAKGSCHGLIKAGGKCSFNCSEGHALVGKKDITCKSNFDWDGDVPKCERSCPYLSRPQNGGFTGKCNSGSIRAKDKCQFDCAAGYVLSGAQSLTCNASFKWDHNPPTCVRTCPATKKPMNGDYSGKCNGQINVGDQCHFTCSPGYTMKGGGVISCRGNYAWDQAPPTCANTCPSLTPLGSLKTKGTCEGAKGGDRCAFSCPEGHVLEGRNELTCRSQDLEWDGAKPVCEGRCPNLDAPGNGTREGNCNGSATVSQTCTFGCAQGFVLKGSRELTCKRDFTWDRLRPTCVNTCKKVDVPFAEKPGGKCDGSAKPRDSCTVTCSKGYVLKGDGQLTCKADMEWDKQFPICVDSCTSVSNLANGRTDGTCQGSIKARAKCTFTCNDRYILMGPKEIVCKENFDWDQNAPRCEKAKCYEPKPKGMSWDMGLTWKAFCDSLYRRCEEPVGSSILTQCSATCTQGYKEDPAQAGDPTKPCIAKTKCNEVQTGTTTWTKYCSSLNRVCAEPTSSTLTAKCGQCLDRFFEDQKHKGNFTTPCSVMTGCQMPVDDRRKPGWTWADRCAQEMKMTCKVRSDQQVVCSDCLDGFRPGKNPGDPCGMPDISDARFAKLEKKVNRLLQNSKKVEDNVQTVVDSFETFNKDFQDFRRRFESSLLDFKDMKTTVTNIQQENVSLKKELKKLFVKIFMQN